MKVAIILGASLISASINPTYFCNSLIIPTIILCMVFCVWEIGDLMCPKVIEIKDKTGKTVGKIMEGK